MGSRSNSYDHKDKYTDEYLIDLYQQYGSYQKASEYCDCSWMTIYRAVKRSGPTYFAKRCAYCGEIYLVKNSSSSNYCTKRCKDLAYKTKKGIKCNSNIEPYHKICVVCGKPFDTFRKEAVTCSHECAEKHHKGYSGRTWDEYINDLKEETEKRETERKAAKIRKNLIRTLRAYANTKVPRTCQYCGETFYSQWPSAKYCSDECKRKVKNKYKDKRIPKEAIIDTDITLPKLYKRDQGVCWICGGKCDWDDKRVSSSGYEYPGDTYPTKDHVIPVSMGGTESWDNVRLAHWKCNLDKSDNIYPYVPMDKEVAYSYKRKGNQAKKTAQYTLDGKLIKIWESTGQIERELGLKSKHIQNICRGENSKTGNAYGYHWEYVKEA